MNRYHEIYHGLKEVADEQDMMLRIYNSQAKPWKLRTSRLLTLGSIPFITVVSVIIDIVQEARSKRRI